MEGLLREHRLSLLMSEFVPKTSVMGTSYQDWKQTDSTVNRQICPSLGYYDIG